MDWMHRRNYALGIVLVAAIAGWAFAADTTSSAKPAEKGPPKRKKGKSAYLFFSFFLNKKYITYPRNADTVKELLTH